jgi:hydroxymethylpyrimidine/phosphomethylpyrimidine kinase
MNLHDKTGPQRPSVVLLGGLDPGGGAGVLRDLLTAVEFGADAVVVATCITEQDSARVTRIEAREAGLVGQSLSAALTRSRRPGSSVSVKIGMVATAGIARALADELSGFPGPVVCDPVLRASSGGALYDGSREAMLVLARAVTLLTPNLGEAAWLLDRPVEDLSDAKLAALDLVALGVRAVLLKGGHLVGDATDVLVDETGQHLFTNPRIPGPSPRGTGCALASAIAVRLALGDDLRTAVGAAKTWLTAKIANARRVGDEWQL